MKSVYFLYSALVWLTAHTLGALGEDHSRHQLTEASSFQADHPVKSANTREAINSFKGFYLLNSKVQPPNSDTCPKAIKIHSYDTENSLGVWSLDELEGTRFAVHAVFKKIDESPQKGEKQSSRFQRERLLVREVNTRSAKTSFKVELEWLKDSQVRVETVGDKDNSERCHYLHYSVLDETQLAQLAQPVLESILVQLNPKLKTPSSEELSREARSIVRKFPGLIKVKAPEIKALLKANEKKSIDSQAICLFLLILTRDPSHFPIFLDYLTGLDRSGEIKMQAVMGLIQSLKMSPELLKPEIREKLFQLLKARDNSDLTRLYLRQYLPEKLVVDLDEQIYQERKTKQPSDISLRSRKALEKQASEIITWQTGKSATNALALQALIENGGAGPEMEKKVNDFLKVLSETALKSKETILPLESLLLTDPSQTSEQSENMKKFIERTSNSEPGLGLFIHDGIQISLLLNLAEERGLSLEPKLVAQARDWVDKQFHVIWNSGNALVRYNGDSSLSTYAQAALVLAAQDKKLSPLQSEVLKSLGKLREEKDSYSGLPKLYNYTAQPERSDATETSSAGRAVTAHLALYRHATSENKLQEARELLSKVTVFESHFSELFELPSGGRTHDRHPLGQGMAAYYGFGNIPFVADALGDLSKETSLTETERAKVSWLIERMTQRTYQLLNSEGLIENNANTPLVEIGHYNLLTGIALRRLERLRE